MVTNVFHEEVAVPNEAGGTDTKVRVYTTINPDVVGVGNDLREACNRFVRSWRDTYFVDPKLVVAD